MKRNRNHHSILAMTLLALIPLAAQATTPANGGIAIDCGHRYISQRDAARVMQTDNLSNAYAKRMTLYANVARICHGGVQRVLLVVDEHVVDEHAVDAHVVGEHAVDQRVAEQPPGSARTTATR